MTARNWVQDMPDHDAYWMDRVLYDVHHQASHLERYKADPDAYMAQIPLSIELKAAIRDNDIGAMYRTGVNPYLLRAHCLGLRIPEPVFLASLRAEPSRGAPMAEIVAVHAASHTPVMLNFPDAITSGDRDDIFATFRQLGQQIREAAPQAVVVVSDDHLHNFFLDNLPAFCIGAAREYAAPVEHWLKVDKHELRGDAALGAHLLGEALAAGFDPAFSMRLTLDHGVLTPLHLAGVAHEVAVVPLLVNCVQPPLPTMARALAWGRMLGAALRSYRGCERVAVLATGGISHDVGTPRMGMVNEAFDREFLRRLESGDDDGLVRFCTDHVDEAGNGAEEIRTWLVARGAAEGARFETLYYKAQPHWYTGIALARWRVGAAGQGGGQVVAEAVGGAA